MLEIIIWMIFFPLSTTVTRYFSDKNRLELGYPVGSQNIRSAVVIFEAIVYIIVLLILIKQYSTK